MATHINLYKKATAKKNFITISSVLLLLILEVFIFSMVSQNMSSKIEALEDEKLSIENNVQQLSDKVASLQKDIQTQRTLPPRQEPSIITPRTDADVLERLMVIAQHLPSKTWLTTLNMQGTHIIIHGKSLDSRVVSQYLTELLNTKKFTKVELILLKKEDRSNIKNFSIKCQLPGSTS